MVPNNFYFSLKRLWLNNLGALAFLAMTCALSAADISLDKLPAAAQKTVKAQLKGGEVSSISKEEDDGKITFEVEAKKGETEWSFTVAADGSLLKVEIPLSEAPAEVQKTVKATVGKGKIDTVTKSIDDGEVTYDVDFTTAEGKDRFLSVDPDGTLNTLEVGLEDLAKPIQDKVKELAGKWQIDAVLKSFEEGKVYWDIQLSLEKQARDFRLADDGKLETEQVFMDGLPAPAKTTIQNRVGEGKLERIDKVYGKGEQFVYQIEAIKNGEPFFFTVGPKGKFLGRLD